MFISKSKQEVYYSQVGGAAIVCLQEVNHHWRDVIIQVLPSCAATSAASVAYAYHDKLMMIWRKDRISLHGMENSKDLGMKLFPRDKVTRRKSWRIFQKAGAIVSIVVSSSITETLHLQWMACSPSLRFTTHSACLSETTSQDMFNWSRLVILDLKGHFRRRQCESLDCREPPHGRRPGREKNSSKLRRELSTGLPAKCSHQLCRIGRGAGRCSLGRHGRLQHGG